MNPTDNYAAAIDAHYGKTGDLENRILTALTAMGKDIDALTFTDLSPVDQFHTGGIDASRHLARLADVTPGTAVLDIGGGLGGPARLLAAEFGATVIVLDLTEAFVTTGAALTTRLKMDDTVAFRHGNALAMPFPDATFDVAWTQHATMNIDDKDQLYAEAFRVLKPGARLTFHEIMAGDGGPPHYPAPWANNPSISFLRRPHDVRSLLTDLGFVEAVWNDVTVESLTWFQIMNERAAAGPPPFGLNLVLGPDFGQRFASAGRNLAEHRISVIQAVFDRP